MSQTKDTIRQFLADGRTDKALAALLQATTDPRTRNDCALLSGRWKANERARNLGTLPTSEYNLEKNNISAAVLALLDELEPSDRAASMHNDKPARNPDIQISNSNNVVVGNTINTGGGNFIIGGNSTK